MTGYGKAEGVVGNRKYNIEVRSLNSKQFDLNTRIPSMFREKEMHLRKLLRSRVVRGKCDFFLFYELDPTEVKHEVNKTIVENYIEQLKNVSGAEESDLLALAMRMPEALQSPREELDDKSWAQIEKLITDALDQFDNFREKEGDAIEADFASGIKIIKDCSANLDPLLDARLKKVRDRIRTNLEEVIDTTKIDESRFEQEVLFYIEKQDDNGLEALARGSSDGLKLAANIAAMLIAFVAFVALINYLLGLIPISGGKSLTIEMILGYLFMPLAWTMGAPWNESQILGSLMGQKLVLTEMIAYGNLSDMISDNQISDRTAILASYALCGFANFASIGIQLGGIGSIAPERRKDLSKLVFKAMLGGALASWLTASIAGIMISLPTPLQPIESQPKDDISIGQDKIEFHLEDESLIKSKVN